MSLSRKAQPSDSHDSPSDFSESLTWAHIRANWKQLGGTFQRLGVSFEWHEFQTASEFDWSQTFHPESVELCLNLDGAGVIQSGGRTLEIGSQSAGFYWSGGRGLQASRPPRQSHRFITVEYSRPFLERHFSRGQEGLHPVLDSALEGRTEPQVSAPTRLTAHHQEMIATLRRPPVYRWAQFTWYQGKALELASLFLFQPPPEQDLFCHRQQLLARDRVEKVKLLLRENLSEPPSLEQIAKKAGCSSFYLSRTFSKETGFTISQYIRQLRMERAAELLKSGKFNVTEAAFEVGYSSLSHFSQAFHDTFGCCPGLYPLMKPKNQKAKG